MSATMTIDLREFSIPEEEKVGRVFSRLRKIDQERKYSADGNQAYGEVYTEHTNEYGIGW